VSAEEQLLVLTAAVRSSPHNLVSRAARDALDVRHLPESVAFAKWLPPGIDTLVDIGSGGGFPGVVIAVMRPEVTVHLVESVGKKAQFLTEIVAELELNCVVHYARVEALGRLPDRPRAQAVTARAVASLAELGRMAAPFLAPGGFLYAIKGERWPDEVAAAQQTLKRVKFQVHALPADGDDPADGALPRIVTLRKV